ncbi:MAG: MoaD/ThiS family protein [Gemmatimonadaceae bacterium]
MNVTVRMFAAFADAVGSDTVTVSLPDPASVGALRDAVSALSPALPPRPVVAVNETYATDDVIIHPGDEVAVIPPVAGG